MNHAFNNEYAYALGWTLIHSLWQGAAIAFVVWALLKMFGTSSSARRYWIACAGMVGVVIAAIATFIVLCRQVSAELPGGKMGVLFITTAVVDGNMHPQNWLSAAAAFMHAYIDVFLYGWFCGAMLFAFRLCGGWLYVGNLVRNAHDINNVLAIRLNELRTRLQIRQIVRLAESAAIHTPMVIGYLKPVILLPVGILSGLSVEQIETILLHELAHIRRNDFLVNIVQSCIEVVFFFNPFVWLISSVVRQEREFCCDDAVIRHHGNRIDYAQALARIAETRILNVGIGVTLADNSHQLLNRIKRIMDRSFKSAGERQRLLPVALVVMGLLCASWLTISINPHTNQDTHLAADTVKKKSKSGTYRRSKVVVTDKDGETHEYAASEFEGDEELFPIMEIPEFPEIPDMAAMNDAFSIPPIEPFEFEPFALPIPDSIPQGRIFRGREWDEFSEEFEKKLKERFREFYEKNHQDIEKMMQELESEFRSELSTEQWEQMQVAAEIARRHADGERERFESFPVIAPQMLQAREESVIAMQHATHAREAAAQEQQRVAEIQQEQLQKVSEQMKEWELANQARVEALQAQVKAIEENTREFEAALRKELIKDGYIGKDEEIEELRLTEKGDFTINGKTIKDADRKKYRELHRKYFKHRATYAPE